MAGITERRERTKDFDRVPQHVKDTLKKYDAFRDRHCLPPKFSLLQGLRASITDGVANFDALEYVRENTYGVPVPKPSDDANKQEQYHRTWRETVSVASFYSDFAPALVRPEIISWLPQKIGLETITAASGEASERLYERFMGKGAGVEEVRIFDPARKVDIEQKRFLLDKVGDGILTMDEYRKRDGYTALDSVLEMKPEDRSAWILKQVTASELVGWGGAHFKAGGKWGLIAGETEEKFKILQQEGKISPNEKHQNIVLINFDEGEEPAIGKDRAIARKNPHAIVEGTILAAIASHSTAAIIYTRGDYVESMKSLQSAIDEARTAGYVYDPETGKGLVDIIIYRGGGSYVIGNIPNMIQSMSGERPKAKKAGRTTLYGGGINRHPTLATNIETVSNIPAICRLTGEKYKKVATKIIGISGDVHRRGLIEMRRGLITAGQFIDTYSGGADGEFLLYQPGGVSTPALRNLDIPLDVETIKEAGSSWGTAMMGVLNKDTDLIKYAGDVVRFYGAEPCHHCGSCFSAEKGAIEIFNSLSAGKGAKEDLEWIEQRQRYLTSGPTKKEMEESGRDFIYGEDRQLLKAGCGLGEAVLAFAASVCYDPELRKRFEAGIQK